MERLKMERWIDMLPLEHVANSYQPDKRLPQALYDLSAALTDGPTNMSQWVTEASALIVVERRRLTKKITLPALGIDIKKRGDHAVDGSLLSATASVANALLALEDQATALAVSHLRWAEAELRVLHKFFTPHPRHTPFQEVLDQRRERRGR